MANSFLPGVSTDVAEYLKFALLAYAHSKGGFFLLLLRIYLKNLNQINYHLNKCSLSSSTVKGAGTIVAVSSMMFSYAVTATAAPFPRWGALSSSVFVSMLTYGIPTTSRAPAATRVPGAPRPL